MSEQPPHRFSEHARARARSIDLGITAAAVGCWVAAVLLPTGLATSAAVTAATALTTLAVLRPRCRSLAERSVEAATWAAEREREHALATAAKHVEAWRAIVDTATEGIVTIDARGHVETVNDAALELFGYERAELIGQNVKMLMPEPYRGEHDGYLERYLRTGERRIIGIGREVTGLRKDGAEFPIDLSVGEGSMDGRPFFTAVIRDVSERKELQSKLAQSERLAAVGELAAGVAHEINNPINTMINCAQLIQDGDEPEHNGRIIIEEGGRIADIVRALLQFARDDRDQAQPTSLAEVVDRTMSLIGESWKRHGIHLDLDVSEDLPNVYARPQKVQQVLLNLMINAKDILVQQDSSRRRQVAIQAERRMHGVQMTVSDNGPGIDPVVRDRIFEPFVTTKRARGGTGLGLSISRSIIEGYGGTIRVDSEPGSGAAFVVWLPLAPNE
jgi:two-component system sensor kinase FixL